MLSDYWPILCCFTSNFSAMGSALSGEILGNDSKPASMSRAGREQTSYSLHQVKV